MSTLVGLIGSAFLGAPLCAEERPLRLVAFGTSLTALGTWPKDIAPPLSRCLGRPVEVETVARPGSTSDWGLSQVGRVVSLRPDVVLTEFYANDAALDRFTGVAHSRRTMARILGELKAGVPEARVFLMRMNPILGRRGWIRPFLDDYIAAHKEVADEAGAGYIDFAPKWDALSADALADAIPDGSHPRPAVASALMVPEIVARLCGARAGTAEAGKRERIGGAPPQAGDREP